jgi:hypothetical protein
MAPSTISNYAFFEGFKLALIMYTTPVKYGSSERLISKAFTHTNALRRTHAVGRGEERVEKEVSWGETAFFYFPKVKTNRPISSSGASSL